MTRRTRLLLAVAASAVIAGGAASKAMAFDVVDWEWNKLISENVVINITVDSFLLPDGLVEVEKLQMYIGDVKAKAEVKDIENNPPGEAASSGSLTIDELALLNGTYTGADPAPISDVSGPVALGTTGLSVQLRSCELGDVPGVTCGSVEEGEDPDQVNPQVRVFGTIEFDPLDVGVHEAFDLPKIENAATAVANNQSINADVPILLHDAQFYFGGFNDFSDADRGEVIQGLLGLIAAGFAFEEYADANIHTALALALTAAAAGGIVEKGEVEAEAKVSDILNAYVENSATAVVNNASFTIESAIPNNHILIADLTQWAYADVEAEAKVRDVTINGYTGFGDACFGGACEEGGIIKPIVANVATAVGNNLNIKVGGPEGVVAPPVVLE